MQFLSATFFLNLQPPVLVCFLNKVDCCKIRLKWHVSPFCTSLQFSEWPDGSGMGDFSSICCKDRDFFFELNHFEKSMGPASKLWLERSVSRCWRYWKISIFHSQKTVCQTQPRFRPLLRNFILEQYTQKLLLQWLYISIKFHELCHKYNS
jgi:hypothetical protein